MYRNLPLHSPKGRLVGEIDLIAVNKTTVDIFEVKCSFRPVKARKQLAKIKKIFGSEIDKTVNTWFYCGEASQLVRMV